MFPPRSRFDSRDLEAKEARKRVLVKENEELRRRIPRRGHGKVRSHEQQDIDTRIATIETMNEWVAGRSRCL